MLACAEQLKSDSDNGPVCNSPVNQAISSNWKAVPPSFVRSLTTLFCVACAGTVKPHHVVTPEGVALGYSHLGMLAAARWLLGQTKADLIQALQQHPGYQLRVVGEWCWAVCLSIYQCYTCSDEL